MWMIGEPVTVVDGRAFRAGWIVSTTGNAGLWSLRKGAPRRAAEDLLLWARDEGTEWGRGHGDAVVAALLLTRSVAAR